MKKLKLFLAILSVFALFGGVGVVKANTAVTIASGDTNSSITLSRAVTSAKQKVTNTFTYTITADSSNPAGVTGLPAAGATTTKTIAMSAQALSGTTATKTTTLSLVGVIFTKPGDYIYTVTETGTTDSTTYPLDTTNKYTFKVSVRNTSASNFQLTATILLYTGTGSSATKKTDNTTFAFTKAATYRTISITKNVQGIMADTDDYFAIKVTINGNSGETYTVTGQSKSGAPTSITSGTATTLYLKHGETAQIAGVINGKTYSFEELADATSNKYEATYINGSTTNSKLSGTKTVGATNTNTIVNEDSSPGVLTGLAIKFLPFVLIVAAALAAIIVLLVKNSKNKKNNLEFE